MTSFLRQSTASQSRSIGPFLDDTDFKTPETALTIANTDIKIVANGGASANKNSGGGTHRANGVYGVTFDATDTATVGEWEVVVVVTGALPVFHKFWVLEEAVYDALFAASAPGYLQPTTAGRTLDVSAGGEAGIDWANIGSPTTAQTLSGTSTKALEPTTAGRTLDVTTTGEAGIDWGNIGSPTSAQALTNTTISTTQVVASVAGAVGSVTGNVGGNVVGSVASVSGNVGGNVVGSVGSVTGAVGSVTGAVGSVTGNVGGNVNGSVASVVGLTASNLDATISSRMASYTQPTGFLAATFPTTVASPTNITAGTITTVTNLTNAPTAGDFTATMKTSLNAATPVVTISGVTPSGGLVPVDVKKINAVTVNGAGVLGNEWGP